MRVARYLALASLIVTIGCTGNRQDPVAQRSTENQAEGDAPAQDSGSGSPSGSASHDTPEAVFLTYSQAVENNDWQTAITVITRDSQELVYIGMVSQAAVMTMEVEARGEQLRHLFKKHGIDYVSASELLQVLPEQADLPALVHDLAVWIESNQQDGQSGFMTLSGISNLKIDGDTATAMTTAELGEQPIGFQKLDGQWQVDLAIETMNVPSIDELGLNFDDPGEGKIGWMRVGEKSSGLNHAFAYNAMYWDRPCVVLVLTAFQVTEENQQELRKELNTAGGEELKAGDGTAVTLAGGPYVKLRLSPEGDLMTMGAWIDNSSMTFLNSVPAVDVEIDGGRVSGRVGMATPDFGDPEQFQAKFDTKIRF